MSRDISVSIATGYGLDGRGIAVQFPAGTRDSSVLHSMQTGSGTHNVSYPVGTRSSFLAEEAARA
jgi:hypothetical protein